MAGSAEKVRKDTKKAGNSRFFLLINNILRILPKRAHGVDDGEHRDADVREDRHP